MKTIYKIFVWIALVGLAACESNEPTVSTGVHNGFHYVDLGLPSGTAWATCNIGANSPEEYGHYFAWGETTSKDEYSYNTYKFGNDFDVFTKYTERDAWNPDGDNLSTLEPCDDAAHVLWGGKWRMPTRQEADELRILCSWEKVRYKGKKGCKITGPNGNSIFLPAAGHRSGVEFHSQNIGCTCWTSSVGLWDDGRLDYVWATFICYSVEDKDCMLFSNPRIYGYPIRPVCSPQ